MTLTPGLRKELGFVLAYASGSLIAGLIIGQVAATALVGAIGYLCWHLFQLFRLNIWLNQPKKSSGPIPFGIWECVLGEIEELRERGRKRKRKLGRMLSGFQESTSALPDATVVINDLGEMEWWNESALHILGLKRKHDKGRLISDVMHDRVFLQYLADDDYQQPLKIPAPVDDGITLEVRVVPYGKGKRLLQARDITRLQQLETVRRDFVANVSHEMRTPLTVIHGYLETMLDASDDGLQEWQHVIDQMQQQTTRMQRIVGDLLLLSRIETGRDAENHTEVDVPDMIYRLKDQAVSLSGLAGHRFRIEIDNQLHLLGNHDELESAFSNLVFNAVRYTPERGEIRLQWIDTEAGPCFCVRDTGIGIAAEHIPRLTERFYRVDVGRSRQSGGTGLGLAIVKHALSRHAGYLKISSEEGVGSLFCCHFPRSRAMKKTPRMGAVS